MVSLSMFGMPVIWEYHRCDADTLLWANLMRKTIFTDPSRLITLSILLTKQVIFHRCMFLPQKNAATFSLSQDRSSLWEKHLLLNKPLVMQCQ